MIPLPGFLSAEETVNRSAGIVRCRTFGRLALGKSELSD
jgi:hypothetical protein